MSGQVLLVESATMGEGKTTVLGNLAVSFDSGYAGIRGHDPCQEAHLVRQTLGLINTSERSFYWRMHNLKEA